MQMDRDQFSAKNNRLDQNTRDDTAKTKPGLIDSRADNVNNLMSWNKPNNETCLEINSQGYYILNIQGAMQVQNSNFAYHIFTIQPMRTSLWPWFS